VTVPRLREGGRADPRQTPRRPGIGLFCAASVSASSLKRRRLDPTMSRGRATNRLPTRVDPPCRHARRRPGRRQADRRGDRRAHGQQQGRPAHPVSARDDPGEATGPVQPDDPPEGVRALDPRHRGGGPQGSLRRTQGIPRRPGPTLQRPGLLGPPRLDQAAGGAPRAEPSRRRSRPSPFARSIGLRVTRKGTEAVCLSRDGEVHNVPLPRRGRLAACAKQVGRSRTQAQRKQNLNGGGPHLPRRAGERLWELCGKAGMQQRKYLA